MVGQRARLAQVVDAGPQELAGVFRMVAHGDPLVAVVRVLRADDLARRLLRVRGQNLLLAIVLPDDVQQVGQAVVVVVAGVRTEQRLGHRPRRIVGMEGLTSVRQDGNGDLRMRRVVNFVAGRPEDDAGVIAVAHHRVGRCRGWTNP